MIRRYGERVDPDMQYTPRPGAYVILQRGRDLLLTVQDGARPELQLPGGGIDAGEHVIPALHREVMEETGWRMDLCALGHSNALFICQNTTCGLKKSARFIGLNRRCVMAPHLRKPTPLFGSQWMRPLPCYRMRGMRR